MLAHFFISWAVLIFSLCLCIMSGTCFSLNAKSILIQISASSGSLMNIINKAGCYISPLLVLMIAFACGSFCQIQIHKVPSKSAWIKFSNKIIFDTASKDLFKCKQGIGYFHQPLILWFCCLQVILLVSKDFFIPCHAALYAQFYYADLYEACDTWKYV